MSDDECEVCGIGRDLIGRCECDRIEDYKSMEDTTKK